MSAVYILLWLTFAVGVGWLVVEIDDRLRRMDAEIDAALAHDCDCDCDWCTDDEGQAS